MERLSAARAATERAVWQAQLDEQQAGQDAALERLREHQEWHKQQDARRQQKKKRWGKGGAQAAADAEEAAEPAAEGQDAQGAGAAGEGGAGSAAGVEQLALNEPPPHLNGAPAAAHEQQQRLQNGGAAAAAPPPAGAAPGATAAEPAGEQAAGDDDYDPHFFLLHLRTQGGTYVKEFVHGKRCAALLGCCSCWVPAPWGPAPNPCLAAVGSLRPGGQHPTRPPAHMRRPRTPLMRRRPRAHEAQPGGPAGVQV